MSLMLPSVSTRCPSGPTEMLLEGKGGLLVPVGDVAALAHAMSQAIGDTVASRERAEEAFAHLDRFRPEPVARRYEALADELAQLASSSR